MRAQSALSSWDDSVEGAGDCAEMGLATVVRIWEFLWRTLARRLFVFGLGKGLISKEVPTLTRCQRATFA